MARARDFAGAAMRSRMARQGTDCIDDFGLPGGLMPPRRGRSKAEMRREIEEATAAVSRRVTCAACGHSATVALPPSKRHARLRCSRCGTPAA